MPEAAFAAWRARVEASFERLLADIGSSLGSVGHWFGDTVASFIVGLGWGGVAAALILGGTAVVKGIRTVP